MTVKFPTGPNAVEGLQDAVRNEGESDAITSTAPVEKETDRVTEVALDVASGRITGDEAVERLLEHTMDSGIAAQAPRELRDEMLQVIRTMIETDPYLRSLAGGLGATVDE